MARTIYGDNDDHVHYLHKTINREKTVLWAAVLELLGVLAEERKTNPVLLKALGEFARSTLVDRNPTSDVRMIKLELLKKTALWEAEKQNYEEIRSFFTKQKEGKYLE